MNVEEIDPSKIDDKYMIIELPRKPSFSADTVFGKPSGLHTPHASVKDLLNFSPVEQPMRRTFITNNDKSNNDRFLLINSDFVSENMQKYRWVDFDKKNAQFTRSQHRELLDNSPKK